MASLIDTNVLLRLLIGDVPKQREQALGWLESAENGAVQVVDAVLVELLFQLESRDGYNLARVTYLPAVRALLQSECFRLDIISWIALGLMEHHPKLDYTDCLLLAMARSGDGVDVLTFDRELNRQIGRG